MPTWIEKDKQYVYLYPFVKVCIADCWRQIESNDSLLLFLQLAAKLKYDTALVIFVTLFLLPVAVKKKHKQQVDSSFQEQSFRVWRAEA